jgi:hypothetical protein
MKKGKLMNARTPGPMLSWRKRFVRLFVLASIMWAALTACSGLSRYDNRRTDLQQDVNRFHMALFMQDIPALLRQMPPEERGKWSDALRCFFHRYRVVDYSIQEIKTGAKVEDAKVVVWVTRHPVDALAAQELVWKEDWVYRKKAWRLDTASETSREFFGTCFPSGGDRDGPVAP